MARKYAVGTGLGSTPPTDNEELQKVLIPIHTALNGLAQSVSDFTGRTVIPKADVQGLKATELYRENGKFEFVVQAGTVGTIAYGKLIRTIPSFSPPSTYLPMKVLVATSTSSNSPANGFVSEPEGLSFTSSGRIVLGQGVITFSGGLHPGEHYYLGAAGGISLTPGSFVSQVVGIALTETEFLFWGSPV